MHSNTTIWAIIDADPATGAFDVLLDLPSGLTSGVNGSTPAFTERAHTLRLLTGSLLRGDAPRSLESEQFVVGAYQPSLALSPIEAGELVDGVRNGLSVTTTSTALTVQVAGAEAGDWVFLTVFREDGSPRFPWGWLQADVNGNVTAPLVGVTLPAGKLKIVAQNGNQGQAGELLGWAPLTVSAPPPPAQSAPPLAGVPSGPQSNGAPPGDASAGNGSAAGAAGNGSAGSTGGGRPAGQGAAGQRGRRRVRQLPRSPAVRSSLRTTSGRRAECWTAPCWR